ncbi:DNA-binding CsgD family transcriptional regulator [Parabacteroides sp. PFB2-12]|uniref:helix-turn-helix transcriptional regulator n=1 Tax=unclassified Parabacteroides TaxID=2649774 RepID=UPI002475F3DC|nr:MULTISPECIES: hypothetical protein [unclassified Parabacteroides]MDH6343021.1 DNA-binding CsgD family transcriptional regulator [Parabacteroides sp. PM6-13]MDH6390964.1 DNA-binding CsgD family transcriptional regulator [Parabacteroides sp. PFB2-12]
MNVCTFLALACLFFILLFFLCNAVSRRRYYKLRHELDMKEKELAHQRIRDQEELMNKLIASRQELHNRNEELRRQLKEIQYQPEKVTDLKKVMEMLHPSLLTTQEEEQFRLGFNSLYPTFLHRLREILPTITKGEELFCMLVSLNQTNEEIARTLGISRPSVIKIRYRLRQKIDDPLIENLDEWIRQLAQDTKRPQKIEA